MNQIDVYMCEPFILPGILPTLGLATIKSELTKNGLRSKILYPSIRYFVEQELFKSPFLLSLIEDTPLQLVEYLFVDKDREQAAIEYIYKSLSSGNYAEDKKELVEILKKLHNKAMELVTEIAKEIAFMNPVVFCISTTFGDLNFDFSTEEGIKKARDVLNIVQNAFFEAAEKNRKENANYKAYVNKVTEYFKFTPDNGGNTPKF